MTTQISMDNLILLPAIMTATMVIVTVQAWLNGTEKRDVVFLGSVGGLCGLGTAVAVIV
jgi:hypothetical protein